MANPAELLLDRLRTWHQPTKTASHAREPTADEWAEHRLAVHHLDAIDQLLTEASETRNVSVYRTYFPSWCAAVFAYPNGWSRANSAQIDPRSLEHLENLAEFLRGYVPELAEGGDAQLREYVRRVQATLETDESIPPQLRIHLREVIAYMLRCLDEYEIYGSFELQKAVENFAASVLRTASSSQDKSRWKTVLDGFVWPFAVNVIAALPSAALAQLVAGGG